MSTESTSPPAHNGGGPRRSVAAPQAGGAPLTLRPRPASPRLSRAFAAALLLGGLIACGAPEPIWPAPKAQDVQVFYPVSGSEGDPKPRAKVTMVQIRNDTLARGATTLAVRILPGDQRFSFAIRRDQTYTELRLPAKAGEILELSVQSGDRKGTPVYMQVPAGISDTGLKCTSGGHCEGLPNAACSADTDCTRYQGEAVEIPASGLKLQWRPAVDPQPAMAMLEVPTQPGMLVWVQNRHRVAHGEALPAVESPRLRIATSTLTRFELPTARAGDHIWFRLYRPSRQYSPVAELTVPPSKLVGITVLGLEIEDDQDRTFYISLDGDDHRGFCPPSDVSPPLCLGGGPKTRNFSIGPKSTWPGALGTLGDVRGGPVRVVAVFDVGESIQALDTEQHRIPDVLEILRFGLRSFDHISALTFGPTGVKAHPNFSFKGIERQPSGEGRLTDALKLALKQRREGEQLRIVAIVASNRGEISADLKAELRGTPLHILDVGAPRYNRTPGTVDLEELAVLSDGLVWPTHPFSKLKLMLNRVRNRLVGAYMVRFWHEVNPKDEITLDIGGKKLTGRLRGEIYE